MVVDPVELNAYLNMGRYLVRAALALIASLAFVITAHAEAPPARAECAGGMTYEGALQDARGAIVGTIAAVEREQVADLYVEYASEIRVERTVGVNAGPVWRGKAYAGAACDGDVATVGARVVLLLDVAIPGLSPSDMFFTVGVAVTPAQAGRLSQELPDTSTSIPPTLEPSPLPLIVVLLATPGATSVFIARPAVRRRTR